MRATRQILLASQNRAKFEEFTYLFSGTGFGELSMASDFVRNADKIQHVEVFQTYEENALAKARLVSMCAHYPVLSDDSGLEVRALDMRPGVKSNRYAVAQPGQSQSDANCAKLLAAMADKTDRFARFVCALVFMVEGVEVLARGVLEGSITEERRGRDGFGYDPIFMPNGSQKTLAEMGVEKHVISHRALAVRDLVRQLEQHALAIVRP